MELPASQEPLGMILVTREASAPLCEFSVQYEESPFGRGQLVLTFRKQMSDLPGECREPVALPAYMKQTTKTCGPSPPTAFTSLPHRKNRFPTPALGPLSPFHMALHPSLPPLDIVGSDQSKGGLNLMVVEEPLEGQDGVGLIGAYIFIFRDHETEGWKIRRCLYL